MSNIVTALVGLIVFGGFLYASLTVGHPVGAFLFGLCAFIVGYNTVAYTACASEKSSCKTRTETVKDGSSTKGIE